MSLKKVNDSLALDNKNLQSELSISASRIIVKKAESFANIPSGISN